MISIPNPENLRGFDLPEGRRVAFGELCAACGCASAVTGGMEPLIVFTNDDRLRKGYTRDRRRVYCIGYDLLPRDASEADRAWQALEYLAYGVFDYRARETVSAVHERERIGRDAKIRSL